RVAGPLRAPSVRARRGSSPPKPMLKPAKAAMPTLTASSAAVIQEIKPTGVGGANCAMETGLATEPAGCSGPTRTWSVLEPVMPGTAPLAVCCQNVYLLHPAGSAGADFPYDAIHSG